MEMIRLSTDLQDKFSEIFEKEVVVFPTASGTAANALALSALTPVIWQYLLSQVISYQHRRMWCARVLYWWCKTSYTYMVLMEKLHQKNYLKAIGGIGMWYTIPNHHLVSITQLCETVRELIN